MLQRAGYATALVGKWGLGDAGAAESGLPRRHGFDFFFGYLNQRHAHNHFPDFLWRNETRIALPNEITPSVATVRVFDLMNDPAESENVASRQPTVAEALDSYLRDERGESAAWQPVW